MRTYVEELEDQIVSLRIENARMRDHIKNWQPHEDPRRTAQVREMETMLAVGNGELDAHQRLASGDLMTCPECGDPHPLKYGKAPDGTESNLLLFYTCPKTSKSFLAGIMGRSVT